MKRAAIARSSTHAGGLDVTAIELPAPTPRFLLGLLAAYPILLVAGYALIPSTGGPAPLWPADAVLFLAFLVIPVRRWLLVGLAALGVELIFNPLASQLILGQHLGIGAVLRYLLAHILTDLGPVIVARGCAQSCRGPDRGWSPRQCGCWRWWPASCRARCSATGSWRDEPALP